MTETKKSLRFVLLVLAVLSSFLLNGVALQLLKDGSVTPEAAPFRAPHALMAVQLIVQVLFGLRSFLHVRKTLSIRSVPWVHVILVSGACYISQAAAQTAGTSADVPFLAIVVAKSCKTAAVFIVVTLLRPILRLLPHPPAVATVPYPFTIRDVVATVMLTTGLVLFFAGAGSGGTNLGAAGLLVLSLFFNGITALVQDDQKLQGRKMPPAVYGMLINLCTAPVTLMGAVREGKLPLMVHDMYHYPRYGATILTYAVTSCTGTTAIYAFLNEFGSFITTILTTVRKFLSVLISLRISHATLSPVQMVSITLVFGAVFVLVNWREVFNKNKKIVKQD